MSSSSSSVGLNFKLLECKFSSEWNEQEIIDSLVSINPHASVAVAMIFFGVQNYNVDLKISLEDEEMIKVVFDTYLKSYKYIIDGRIVQKVNETVDDEKDYHSIAENFMDMWDGDEDLVRERICVYYSGDDLQRIIACENYRRRKSVKIRR